MCVHSQGWNCLPENKFLLSLLQFFSLRKNRMGGWGEEMGLELCVLRQGDPGQVTAKQSPSTMPHSGPLHADSSGHLGGIRPRRGSQLLLPWGGSLWIEPNTVGVKAGLLAHCTSLCIPSLFPMQIKLMRIRNIMEPIHRSSRWKMGLTTNFPLQLFCNYRGILWILMEMLNCLTASWLLFFWRWGRRLKKNPQTLYQRRVQSQSGAVLWSQSGSPRLLCTALSGLYSTPPRLDTNHQ